jgi:hypothetical protein
MLWLRVLYTAFVVVLVPAYIGHYGPGNFLWLSDVALFAGCIALWLRHSLLASMQAVAVLVPELVWNIDFLLRVTLNVRLIGMTDYMFDPSIPRFVRTLSLFHIWLPVVLVWMVWRFGYDRRALATQTAVGTCVLIATYLLTSPDVNINLVHRVNEVRGPLALALSCVLFPLVFYVPAHVLFRSVMPPPERRAV